MALSRKSVVQANPLSSNCVCNVLSAGGEHEIRIVPARRHKRLERADDVIRLEVALGNDCGSFGRLALIRGLVRRVPGAARLRRYAGFVLLFFTALVVAAAWLAPARPF